MVSSCNILCSGPSKKSYVDNGLVNISCNVPWTKSEYTLIGDPVVVIKDLEINCIHPETKLVISNLCFQYLRAINNFEKIKHRVHSVYKIQETFIDLKRSTGHYACEWAISQGYNELNIYGCDNYFGDDLCIDNWSHDKNQPHYMENHNLQRPESDLQNRGLKWRRHWSVLINKYNNVKFNFIP
jgi:hypothetical protein